MNCCMCVLVDSRAYVSANARNEVDCIKQQALKKIFKIDELPNFQIQVGNGSLEKPLATGTLKFDIGKNPCWKNSLYEEFVRVNYRVCTSWGTIITSPWHDAWSLTSSTIDKGNQDCCEQIDWKTPVCPPLTIPLRKTKTTTHFVLHFSDCGTTGTGKPLEKFTESSSFSDFPLKVNDSWQESSSKSNQYKGVTIFTRK